MQNDTNLPPQRRLSEREALDYEILALIESEPQITQRELARRMGVSLGRANYCLRALGEKGWVKLERFRASKTKSRYMYVLTPGGIAERAGMAARYLACKRAEYEYLKDQIARLERELPRDAIQAVDD